MAEQLNMDAERAAFEAWARSKGWSVDPARKESLDTYMDTDTEIAWYGWQASRRTAPAAPMGEELPAQLSETRIKEIVCELFADGTFTDDDMILWRAIESEAIAPYAERIRQLERALRSANLLLAETFISTGKAMSPRATEISEQIEQALAGAYIDGRTAGAAPEGWKLVPLKYTPEMRAAWDRAPQSEDDDSDFAGAYAALIAAAPTHMNSGKEEGK
jgi:hypothetical protein